MKLHIWFRNKETAAYYIAKLPEFKEKIGNDCAIVNFYDDRYYAFLHLSHTGDLPYDIEHSYIKIHGNTDDTKAEEYKIILSHISFIGELQ